MKEKNLIRFDWAIKRLLRNKANFAVLEGFLSELLSQNIIIIRILESEGNQQTSDDKYNKVDLLVENEKGEIFIIEVQNQNELDFFHRMTYGTSKVITEYIDMGQSYSEIKKVYSVNIVYFDLGQGEDYIYHGTTDFYGIHQKDKLLLSEKQKLEFGKIEPNEIFPEYYLLKVNQFDDVAKDTLDQWIYYFKNDKIQDNFTAKGLDKAKELLSIEQLEGIDKASYKRYLENLHYKASMAWNIKKEVEWEIREAKEKGIKEGRRDGIKEGRQDGIKEGRQDGIKEGRQDGKKDREIEIVINALKKGMAINDISELTGLSINEINKINEKI